MSEPIDRESNFVYDDELNLIFDKICEVYFPRWNRARLWKAKFGLPLKYAGFTGYCHSKNKRIYLDWVQINTATDPRCFLRAMIIHEICHDISAAHHIRAWVNRVERAREHALKLGDEKLAVGLRNEVLREAGDGALEAYNEQSVMMYTKMLKKADCNLEYAKAVKQLSNHFAVNKNSLAKAYGTMIMDIVNPLKRNMT